jgi:LysR family transcriptional regulator, glycine cleavage system transcriptional activator
MQTPRPSLNALRAFEAAARRRSMSAAAKELSVTHGAISRHVKSLEDTFGVTLLNRGPHSTEPTVEGARLAESLAAAFSAIQMSIEQLKPSPLTLSCSTSIMMYWLIPRIAHFHDKHPDVDLQFNMNHGQVDLVRDKIGVAIRNTMIEPPPDVIVRPLAVEWVGPVCSPEYRRSARIGSFADLAGARRLAPKTRPKAWAEWASATGRDGAQLVAHERYDHFYLMIQAAICGRGIAPVPRMLVLDDLRSGKLVAPFGFVAGPHKLVLWLAPHVRARQDTRALSKWLTEELNESERDDAVAAPVEPRPASRRSRSPAEAAVRE